MWLKMSRRRRRNRKRKNEGMSEAWLLPYADLLTLLLALFIVLFAMSSVDAHRFKQISQVFSGIFIGGTGPLEFQQPIESEDHESDSEKKAEDEMTDEEVDQLANELAEMEELSVIQARINEYIKDNEYEDKFSTSLTEEGLLITISDSVLFESGSAKVRDSDKKTARELAELLTNETPRNVIISGHTDNIPIYNDNYHSNWELSVMRAVNFMAVMLLEEESLDPRVFSAKGYGEFHPVAPNDTVEGRMTNRRVEVLILPRTEEEM